MDDELTPEQRFAAEDAETLVPRALLLGRRPDDVVADLVKLDWSPVAARAFVERVLRQIREFNASPESRQRLIDAAFKQFVGGLLASLATGALTLALLFIGLIGGWLLVIVPLLLFGAALTAAGRGWARWRLYRGWERHLQGREKTDGDQ